MAKMPLTGEDHGDSVMVCHTNGLFVAYGTAAQKTDLVTRVMSFFNAP